MTSPKTPEWAEHWGREAVRLGFVEWLKDFECLQIAWLHCYDAELPNLAHAHTELAVIPWVQAVALEAYGEEFREMSYGVRYDGARWVEVSHTKGRLSRHKMTLAEAACRLVAAMRGEA